MVANRDVAGNLAVIGIHVVNGKAQLLEAVVGEGVLPAGVDENSVPALADCVAGYRGAGRVPDIDAVAATAHQPVVAANDGVAFDKRIARAVNVDAVEIVFDLIVANNGAGGVLCHLHAAVDGLVRSCPSRSVSNLR